MKYEEILGKIGGWGRYQKALAFFVFLSSIPNGFFTMVSVFIMDAPDHHCKITKDNETPDSFHPEDAVSTVNDSIPFVFEKGEWIRSKCTMFNKTASDYTTMDCDKGWTFYPKYGEYTTIMEWDLVCDRKWILPLIVALFMLGVLIGSAVSGAMADRFGRRPVFLWGTLLQHVAMLGVGLSTNAPMFATFMFLSGCTSLINYVAIFVIITEVVEFPKRALVGSLEITGFTIGYMLLPPAAYFLSNWRWLLWFMAAGGILYIPYYWLIPESPRWLIVNGKPEARKMIRKIAKINRPDLAEDDLLRIDKDLCSYESEDEAGEQFSYLDLLRHPIIRTRSLVMFFIWFTTSMTYYCISLGTSNLGGNKFLNCFVAAAVELPAYYSGLYLVEKFGRKPVLISYLVVGGGSCALASAFLNVNSTVVTVNAMISKFACSAVFSLIFIYCCEMFPTKMRNMSVGASSTMARIGAIVAPYLIYAGQLINPSIPYVVLGGLAVVSGGLTFVLPETHNVPLPETMEEAIRITRLRKKISEHKEMSGNQFETPMLTTNQQQQI